MAPAVSKLAVEDHRYPAWVQNLKEYYEVLEKKTRMMKDGNRERKRVYYTLNCLLCKANPSKATKPKEEDSPTVIGNSSFAFERHLKRSHKNDVPESFYKNLSTKKVGGYKRSFADIDDDDEQETIMPSIIGTTLPSSETKKYDENGRKQKEFNQAILDMIVLDGLPMNAPSKEGFRRVMHLVDSQLTCYSGQTYMNHLDKKHAEILNHVKAGLKGIKRGTAHLMMDMWSTRMHMSVIGAQARFIKDWKLYQYVLGFKHFPGAHTADNIRTKLHELLSEDFGLSLDDFHTVTADNASSILSAFKNGKEGSAPPCNPTSSSPSTTRTDDAISTDNNEDELLDVGNDDEEQIARDVVTNDEMEEAMDQVIADWLSVNSQTVRRIRNSCLAHLLQLGIKDALKNKEVAALIQKVNKIVNWFHKSNKFYDALRKMSKIGLVKPCDTRWNSTYHSLKRICRDIVIEPEEEGGEQEKIQFSSLVNKVLTEARKDVKRVPQTLNDDDIATLRVIINILEPFAGLTDLWQGDGVTSSSVILGLIDALRALDEVRIEDISEQAETFLGNFKEQLKASIILRFSTNPTAGKDAKTNGGRKRNIVTTDIFNDERYILATLLDPRMKTVPFEEQFNAGLGFHGGIPSKEKAIDVLKAAFKIEQEGSKDVELLSEGETSSQNSVCSPSSSSIGQSKKSSVTAKKKLDIFARIQQHQESQASKDSVVDEIAEYLRGSTISHNQNPLNFWRLNEERFPVLAELAKKYLAIPATSASVERLFSVAGAMISSRRASMHISTAEKLILYKDYLRRGVVKQIIT